MERAEIERFKRRLESLEPTPENLKRVAAARGNPVDPRMLNEEVREMTARFLLLETDATEEPGAMKRLRIFLEHGNVDISSEVATEAVLSRGDTARAITISEPGKHHRELFKALKRKDIARVVELILDGADIDSKDANGWTPLIYAVVHLHAVVPILVLSGANVNAKDTMPDEGLTATMHVLSHCPKYLLLLLSAGADPTDTDAWGRSAFVYTRDPESVRKLSEHGANVNWNENGDSETPLHVFNHISMEKGKRREVLRALLEVGADPAARNIDGNTPLELFDLREDLLAVILTNKEVFRENASAAIHAFLSDEDICSKFDFALFLWMVESLENGRIELDAHETKNLVEGMRGVLEEFPESIDKMSKLLNNVFGNNLEEHADDSETGPSISLLISTMAALSECESAGMPL